ncbi:hypothetical protein ACWDSJ_20545 [Nocardia sp. NPDC003482]
MATITLALIPPLRNQKITRRTENDHGPEKGRKTPSPIREYLRAHGQ